MEYIILLLKKRSIAKLIFLLAFLHVSICSAQTGGSDSEGYVYADSNEASCNTGFFGIAATGTDLGLADYGKIAVTTPFDITLYGVTSTDLFIENNGALVFGTTTARHQGYLALILV